MIRGDLMFDKLDAIEEKYDELTKKIADPNVIADREGWQKLVKEHASLEEIVVKYKEYKETINEIEENKALLREKLDDDFKELVESEVEELEDRKAKLEEELKILLLPKDPNDEKTLS